ncbi:MAG: VirB8/TrbF family protein [Pseudomonadota bacterium]
MFGKKKDSPQIENTAAKGINFEVTIADIARRSEKRAWMIAWTCIFIVLVMLGGFVYILPLKKEVPYLIMADAFTGQATVATLRGDFSSPNSITQSEALNRANVAQYITARESFDVAMMNLRDWDLVNVMSSPNVRNGYAAIHAGNNPDSPFKKYGKERAVRVKILSVQLDRTGQGETARNSATVRFQRVEYDKKTGDTKPIDSKIARLEYTYKANLAMDEKQRYNNPLGFQVTEYTVDNDFAASPPVENPVSAQPQAGYPVQPGAQPYPGQVVPGQAVPGQVLPGQAVPGQAVPGQAIPGQPVPGQPVQGAAPAGQVYPAAPNFGPPGTAAPAQYPAGTVPAQPQVPAQQAPNQVNGVGNR